MKRAPKFACAQRGMVLVTSLLLLVVVTILAVSMFRSFGVDEKIAGNVREKQKALNAAETAEEYAETWLAQGLNTAAITCTGMVTASVGQVCINTLASLNVDPAVLPWTIGGAPARVNYIPVAGGVTMPIATTGGQTGGIDNYYNNPAYYIGYLGSTTTNRITTTYYQIDAVGYGSSADTAAVVESTYITTTTPICFSC